MAYQLIYTSAPRLLEAGKTGFGTVARSRGLGYSLISALERISTFSRNDDLDDQRRIFAYRVITIGSSAYHVLSSIADCGSDYTGRTNHIAHHLVLMDEEVDDLRFHTGFTPAGLALALNRQGFWKQAWTDDPALWEDNAPWQPACATGEGEHNAWKHMTGDADNSRHLRHHELGNLYLILPVGNTPDMTLRLLDEAASDVLKQGWGSTWITEFDSNYQPADFACICVTAGTAASARAEAGRRRLVKIGEELLPPAPSPPAAFADEQLPPGISIQDAPEVPSVPPPHLRGKSMLDTIRTDKKSVSTPSSNEPEDDTDDDTPSGSSHKTWLAASVTSVVCLAAFYLYTRQDGSRPTDLPRQANTTMLPPPSLPEETPLPPIQPAEQALDTTPPLPPTHITPKPEPAAAVQPIAPPSVPTAQPAPAVPRKQSLEAAILEGTPIPSGIAAFLDTAGTINSGRFMLVGNKGRGTPNSGDINNTHPLKIEKTQNGYNFSYRSADGQYTTLLTISTTADGTLKNIRHDAGNVIADISCRKDGQTVRLILVPDMSITIPSETKLPPAGNLFNLSAEDLLISPVPNALPPYDLRCLKPSYFPSPPVLKYAGRQDDAQSLVTLPSFPDLQDSVLLIEPAEWNKQPVETRIPDKDIYKTSREYMWVPDLQLAAAFKEIVSTPHQRPGYTIAALYGTLDDIRQCVETNQDPSRYVTQYGNLIKDRIFASFIRTKLQLTSQYTTETTYRSEIAKPAGYGAVMKACRQYIAGELKNAYDKLVKDNSGMKLKLAVVDLNQGKLTWIFKEEPVAARYPTKAR